jgi:signal transduction histidine kinase
VRGEIVDNGRGFRPDEAHARARRPHMGLEITRERLELAGGTLEIESAPGVGTSVRFAIPLR